MENIEFKKIKYKFLKALKQINIKKVIIAIGLLISIIIIFVVINIVEGSKSQMGLNEFSFNKSSLSQQLGNGSNDTQIKEGKNELDSEDSINKNSINVISDDEDSINSYNNEENNIGDYNNEENYKEDSKKINDIENSIGDNDKSNIIQVHIAGYVNVPGIVKLTNGARISDAIDKADGLNENADITYINLAYKLNDGDKIYIPSSEEVEEAKKQNSFDEKTSDFQSGDVAYKIGGVINNSSNANGDNTLPNNNSNFGRVNINTATEEDLQKINGVGPSLAKKIIKYREQNGKFKTIEDIKNVSGIGGKKFESIKDDIEV